MSIKYCVGVLLFCTCVASVISCEKNTGRLCSALPSGDTVVFDSSEPVPVFAGCGQEIQASVKISDSRCPKNVVCIWQGILLADLTLGNNFSIHLEQNKALDTVYQNEHYRIKLIDAIPYPDFNAMNTPQKAVISISKQ